MAPVSGSAYSYAYLAFGELIAFVIGWDLILEYALQAATVSAGWSGYFNKLLEGFGLHLPVELTAAYGTTPGVTTYFNLPGFVIVLIITWVLSIGINQTKKTNDIMVMIKLAIIVLFIVCTVWLPASTPERCWTPLAAHRRRGKRGRPRNSGRRQGIQPLSVQHSWTQKVSTRW